jgi:predicted nucleotide-binding protein/fido (protein-threonine AMPylation protein)
MSNSGERHSKLVAPVIAAPQFAREEVVRREAENGLRQADRMFEIIDHAISAGKLRLRPSTLIELNRLAVNGLVAAPGAFRSSAIVIEHSQHIPPPYEDVPAHVDDLCDYVAAQWDASYATHLAAYVLWRLNWIHPFEDGNGRTARAVSYLVLCVKLGHKLPGARTIPEFIAADKKPYYNALESADASWKKGVLDLTKMEELLKACLAAQLVDVVQQASAPAAAPAAHAELSVPDGSRATEAAAFPGNVKPRIFVGSSVEGLSVAEALQVGLEYDAEVTIWSQGVFGLSGDTLETLVKTTKAFDFAIFVLTPDDLVTKRGEKQRAARDNVIFELGLFMGSSGRHRTFFVHPRLADMALPSDLAGITAATYDSARSDGDLQAALGPACTKIKRAVRDQGRRT